MLMKTSRAAACLLLLASVSACAAAPIGPSVAVMPAPSKPFEVFAGEQSGCETYASQQIAGQPAQAARSNIVRTLVRSGLGAGLGAAIGGGGGAAIGAASGAVMSTITSGPRKASQADAIQQRYDIAYEQCMYSKGNQVPGFAATQDRD